MSQHPSVEEQFSLYTPGPLAKQRYEIAALGDGAVNEQAYLHIQPSMNLCVAPLSWPCTGPAPVVSLVCRAGQDWGSLHQFILDMKDAENVKTTGGLASVLCSSS